MSAAWSRRLKPALRRLWEAIAVVVVVGTLTFFLTQSLPGDLAYRTAAARYGYDMVTSAAAESVRIELALDQSLWQRWAQWLLRLVQFDLGRSTVNGEPVAHVIAHELGHTLLLAFCALVLTCGVGVPLGFLAARKPGGWFDRTTEMAAIVSRALPSFVVGLLLVMLFSVNLNLFAAAGHGTVGNLWLPTLTLALGLSLMTARVARDAMVDVVASPYYRFALTTGRRHSRVLLRHGVRNALLPVVAYLGVQAMVLIEGVVIVETLFAWPGIGHALVHAVFARDIPVLQGAALAMGLLFVALNSLIDVASWLLDPRLRAGGHHA